MTVRMHRLLKPGVVLSMLFLVLAAQAQLPKITFAPQWIPQAQFAGYYVAQAKGFYKEAGIEVRIVHPSANIQATAMLSRGEVDVTSLFLVTAMAARKQGLDIVNIGQISQHSAILFVTKKSGGIHQLDQLNGKKIGIWKSGFDEVPKALMAEKKYSVEWVPILTSVNLFLMGGIDAMTVMSYNEYDQIINSGINQDELNVFPVADYGFDVPEDGLYCLQPTMEHKKEELKKFIQATMRGWDYAAANKTYAIDLVLVEMQKAHLQANRAHQAWMLDKILEAFTPGNKGTQRGELLEADFQKAADALTNLDHTKPNFSFSDFYHPVFK